MTESSTGKLVQQVDRLVVASSIAFCLYGFVNPASAADHYVSAQTSTFNCSNVLPGDTVTLAAGTRNPLTISKCKGSATKPIVIRNDSKGPGPVVIRRAEGGDGGFVMNCVDFVHVAIDGSTKWAGAPSGTTYGIKLTMTGGGSPTGFLRVAGLSSYVTIRGVEIDGAWPAIATNGIGIMVNDHSITAADHPGAWLENILIERNYVHDIEGEGMYVGPNWRQYDSIRLRNIEIRNNVVTDIGWDGIQLKSAIAGNNSIHHNIVRRAGKNIDSAKGQHYGISIYEGTGRIFNNWVEDAGENGISHYIHWMPKSYGSQPVEIFNNVVVGAGKTGPLVGHGIVSANQTGYAPVLPSIYNNTVIRSKGSGVRVGPEAVGGFVRDNIVADAADSPISAPGTVKQLTNRVGTTTQMVFEDATRLNFKLKEVSPARNAAGSKLAVFDFDDVDRPEDEISDQGAYEFRNDSLKPAAPTLVAVQ